MGRGENKLSANDILYGGGAFRGGARTAAPPLIPPEPLDPQAALQAFADGRLAIGTGYGAAVCSQIKIVSKGSLLIDYSKNEREYQGAIGIGVDDSGDPCFAGITAYGRSGAVGSLAKVVYRGKSLRVACDQVNEMIRKKLQKGYQAAQSQSSLLDPEQVLREIDSRLTGPQKP